MGFVVFDKTFAPNGKVRYLQFGDAHETIQEARKAAQFPGLRDPLIVDLARAEKVDRQAMLRLQRAQAHSPVRPRRGSRGRSRAQT